MRIAAVLPREKCGMRLSTPPSGERLATAKDPAAVPPPAGASDLQQLDAKMFAELLVCSERTIWRLESARKLPRPTRIGRLVRWSLAEIRDWRAADCPDRERWEAIKAAKAAQTNGRHARRPLAG
jgi:predicted DNA-binding transcriptional regulator AlpA